MDRFPAVEDEAEEDTDEVVPALTEDFLHDEPKDDPPPPTTNSVVHLAEPGSSKTPEKVSTNAIINDTNDETKTDTKLPRASEAQQTACEANSSTAWICSTRTNCDYQKIILGEPEKEQLKAAGKHLLEIGQQLLEEMNFVEGLLGKLGSLIVTNNQTQNTDVSNGGTSSHENHELVKQEIISSAEAIVAHGQRLNLIQKMTAEYREASLAAKFGSTYNSPLGSNSRSFDYTPQTNMTSSGSSDESSIQKRLNLIESKVEDINSKVTKNRQQITEVNGNLGSLIDTLTAEITNVKQQVVSCYSQTDFVASAMEGSIHTFEHQIKQLAKLVWELKCEMRAQMHFGNTTNTNTNT